MRHVKELLNQTLIRPQKPEKTIKWLKTLIVLDIIASLSYNNMSYPLLPI